jgi:hypothetical protein
MIRAGRLVHQGSVAELRAAQQAEFLVAPDRDVDRDLLGGLLKRAGLAAAASLFVILVFSRASANGGLVTLHQLAQPNGLVLSAVYLIAALAAAMTVFLRSDVTA